MRLPSLVVAVTLIFLGAVARSAASESPIALLPPEIALNGPKSTHRLLVEKRDGERWTGDLTARAAFRSSNPQVAVVSRDSTVRPVGDGAAVITARVGAETATALVRVAQTKRPFVWSFRNHVLPVM